VRASGAPRFSNANFASAARARLADAALAAVLLFTSLLRLFDAPVFLAGAAFASLFAAARGRDAVPESELFRFRFKGFATTFFIFARMALRATRAFDAGLVLPTRLRTLDADADASLEMRFDAVFALEAGADFFVFDFVVFFDLLRAAIVKFSTRDRARSSPCANSALQNGERTLCQRIAPPSSEDI